LDLEQAEEDMNHTQASPNNQVDEEEDGDASKIYKAFFEKLTSAQQHALLTGKGLSHFRFPPDPSHNLRSAAPGPGREQRRIVPMRPLDIGKDWFLDYISPQTIKFYNKAIEKLQGDTFDGKMLYTWLRRVYDKARAFAWLPILTIDGKELTKHYAEISLAQVRAHAQIYQDSGRRKAQNAEQLLSCLQASISKYVYNRIHQLESKYTITRQPEGDTVLDGVCYLKVIIDCYHVNTRSSTAQVRKKLANLDGYMKNVAKGDVVQLCVYTRGLLDQLRAAGEDTLDLLVNLMEALKLTPNTDFKDWLKVRLQQWSTKQIDYKQDGSDLMAEAEEYYAELKTTRAWKHNSNNTKRDNVVYALQTLEDDEDITTDEEDRDKKPAATKEGAKIPNIDLAALAAQLQTYSKSGNNDSKYSWKYVNPQDGETTKKVFQNGIKQVFYWCAFHKMWTRHKPSECKRYPMSNRYSKKQQKGQKRKRSDYIKKKQEFLQAKAAFKDVADSTSSNQESSSEDDGTSTSSCNTEYMSDYSNTA
jgi:hypothetical protein